MHRWREDFELVALTESFSDPTLSSKLDFAEFGWLRVGCDVRHDEALKFVSLIKFYEGIWWLCYLRVGSLLFLMFWAATLMFWGACKPQQQGAC